MNTVYDDYYIQRLMESIEYPANKGVRSSANMFNGVSELIGIEPLARNVTDLDAQDGTNCDQYLLYMILKLGERVVELESKMNDISPELS